MHRKRFHEILHSNSEIIETVNNTNIVFAIKPVKPKILKNLEETDKEDEVDILYLPLTSSSEEDHEDIDYSEIYVGDCQETDIHMINPLLSDSTNNNKQ